MYTPAKNTQMADLGRAALAGRLGYGQRSCGAEFEFSRTFLKLAGEP